MREIFEEDFSSVGVASFVYQSALLVHHVEFRLVELLEGGPGSPCQWGVPVMYWVAVLQILAVV